MGKIDRQKVFDKCGGKCGYCGCDIDIKNFQVDHIVSQFHYKFKKHLKYTDNNDVNHFENLLLQNRHILVDQMEYLMTGVPKHSRILLS